MTPEMVKDSELVSEHSASSTTVGNRITTEPIAPESPLTSVSVEQAAPCESTENASTTVPSARGEVVEESDVVAESEEMIIQRSFNIVCPEVFL